MIVLVTLAIDTKTGEIKRTDPFQVSPLPPHRTAVYENEPDVLAQFLPGGDRARFEAEWTEDGWNSASASPTRERLRALQCPHSTIVERPGIRIPERSWGFEGH